MCQTGKANGLAVRFAFNGKKAETRIFNDAALGLHFFPCFDAIQSKGKKFHDPFIGIDLVEQVEIIVPPVSDNHSWRLGNHYATFTKSL